MNSQQQETIEARKDYMRFAKQVLHKIQEIRFFLGDYPDGIESCLESLEELVYEQGVTRPENLVKTDAEEIDRFSILIDAVR